jgi:hypothetical protein
MTNPNQNRPLPEFNYGDKPDGEVQNRGFNPPRSMPQYPKMVFCLHELSLSFDVNLFLISLSPCRLASLAKPTLAGYL